MSAGIELGGSNRTFMELKFQSPSGDLYQEYRSNRTFMELKYLFWVARLQMLESSNRTFMELKFPHQGRDRALSPVLIVPLWN